MLLASRIPLQAKYRQALSLGLEGREAAPDARFGAGWCLTLCGEAVLAAAKGLPDAQISWETERQAQEEACALYTQAVQEYLQVWLYRVPACTTAMETSHDPCVPLS